MNVQLKRYMELYRSGNEKQLQGLLVDMLKNVPYFRDLANTAGNSIILKHLPLLQYYVLRNGKQLVSEKDYFILLEGSLIPSKSDNLYGSPMPQGFLIEVQNWQNTTFLADGDCFLLKVYKTSKKDAALYQSIYKVAKQSESKMIGFKRIAMKNQQVERRLQIIKKAEHLKQLPQFDKYQLALDSNIQIISKQSQTHQRGSFCDKIGYIFMGRLRIVHYDPDNPEVHILDKILQKYLNVKPNIQKDGLLNSQIGPEQWIGMEQFLFEKPYCTSGQVVTQQCQLLWIPVKIFADKFNSQTNFAVIKRVKGIIAAKKSILDKSLHSKKNKKQEMQVRKQRKRLSLLDKLNNLSQTIDASKSQAKTIRISNQDVTLDSCKLPIKLFHKGNQVTKKGSSLAKMPQNMQTIQPVNLFPDQFLKANLPLDMGSEIDMRDVKKLFDKKRNSDTKQLSFRQQLNQFYGQRNPQKIYKHIVQTVGFRNQYQQNRQRILQNLTKKHKQTHRKIQYMNTTFLKTRGRFNQSIYNNFRVHTKSKERGVRSLNTNKTLQIE